MPLKFRNSTGKAFPSVRLHLSTVDSITCWFDAAIVAIVMVEEGGGRELQYFEGRECQHG